MVKTLLNTIKQIYKLRSCSLKLTSENIKSGKFKPCLEYHIGNCKAPCIGLQDEFDYEENINQIEGILKGNISSVIEHLKDLMMKYSSETRFEEAQIIKEKIEILSKYKSRSNIVNPKIKNVDVFGFTADSSRTYVSFMKVVNGAVIQAYTLDLKHRVDEEEKSLLSYAITEIKQRLSNDSPEFINTLFHKKVIKRNFSNWLKETRCITKWSITKNKKKPVLSNEHPETSKD
jgi:excinuclease ABC subunit C